jgi:hypothetical protein
MTHVYIQDKMRCYDHVNSMIIAIVTRFTMYKSSSLACSL